MAEPGWAELVREQRDAGGLPGVAVGAVAGGRTVTWAEGVAHAAGATPLTPHSRLRAHSLGKPLLAAASLRLSERGQLDLDAPVAEVLGDDRVRSPWEQTAPITLRALLTHSAGLPQHPARIPPAGLSAFVAGLSAEAPAGARVVYSNPGYDVAALVIERALGRRWTQIVQEEVLTPLEMAATAYEVAPATEVRGHYLSRIDGSLQAIHPSSVLQAEPSASGSLVSTAADLTAFAAACLEGSLVSPAGWRAMAEVQVALGAAGGMGLGLRVEQRSSGRRWVGHAGDSMGFQGLLALLPDEGCGVVVLANRGDAAETIGRLAEGVLAALAGGEPAPPAGDVDPALCGRYRLEGSETTAVRIVSAVAADGRQALDLWLEGRPARLQRRAAGIYQAAAGPFVGRELGFVRRGEQLTLHGGVYPLSFTRSAEAPETAPPAPEPLLPGRWQGSFQAPVGPISLSVTRGADGAARIILLGHEADLDPAGDRLGARVEIDARPLGLGALLVDVALQRRGACLVGRVLVRGVFGEAEFPIEMQSDSAGIQKKTPSESTQAQRLAPPAENESA